LKYLLLHKALGVSLAAFVLARLWWRSSNAIPKPLPAPVWQLKAASWVHGFLYILLLAMPFSGMAMTQLAGRPISLFGWFDLPQLLTENKALAGEIKGLHTEVFWPLLLLLSLGHIAAAWFHQVAMKDNLIKRMLP
jgi:cytochrome b561